MRRLGPVWTLLFLAPLIGEVLFGATPLSRLPAVLLQVGLYGGAAVLIRELVVRRNRRQWWLVVLGLAYGMFEEGLVLQSLFNAHFRGLDVLGSYGRAAGVNWIWAMFIVPYHAVFSIAIPIVFTELLFPAWRGKPWLGKRGLWSVAAVLVINAVFLAAMIAHVFTASDLPWRQPDSRSRRCRQHHHRRRSRSSLTVDRTDDVITEIGHSAPDAHHWPPWRTRVVCGHSDIAGGGWAPDPGVRTARSLSAPGGLCVVAHRTLVRDRPQLDRGTPLCVGSWRVAYQLADGFPDCGRWRCAFHRRTRADALRRTDVHCSAKTSRVRERHS